MYILMQKKNIYISFSNTCTSIVISIHEPSRFFPNRPVAANFKEDSLNDSCFWRPPLYWNKESTSQESSPSSTTTSTIQQRHSGRPAGCKNVAPARNFEAAATYQRTTTTTSHFIYCSIPAHHRLLGVFRVVLSTHRSSCAVCPAGLTFQKHISSFRKWIHIL